MAEAENTESSAPKKDFGKIFAFAFMGLNIAVLGVGIFLVYSATLGHKTKVSTEDQLIKELEEFRKSLQTKPVIYTMDTLNTNLDGVPKRLIRMELNLEMLDEEGFEEVIESGAETRDAVVKILNTTNYSELETIQGKLFLKNRIIAELNTFLDRGVVKNVYFSDFVVQ